MLFADHVNPRLVNGASGGLQFGSGDLVWFPLSVDICLGLVVEYWPFVGTCTHHSYSKLDYLCHLASLFKLDSLVHTGPILMNPFKKSSKTGENQPLSTCQLVVQKLIDN